MLINFIEFMSVIDKVAIHRMVRTADFKCAPQTDISVGHTTLQAADTAYIFVKNL